MSALGAHVRVFVCVTKPTCVMVALTRETAVRELLRRCLVWWLFLCAFY